VQLTLRDTDESRLLARLQTVLERYPVAEKPASQSQDRGKDFCAIHQTTMKLNQKDGRSWYSHRLDDGTYCKGRVRR
jgi:hypothetical protein